MFLIQFHFQSYGATNDGDHAVLSLDKYLGVDVWSQIYKKLELILQAYDTNENGTANGEIISLNPTQLEMDVSWKTFRSYHKDIVRLLKGKSCENQCAKILNVKVRMISALEKFKKPHGLEKIRDKKSTESVDCEPDASSSSPFSVVVAAAAVENRSSNASSKPQFQPQNDEEYIPAPITDISSSHDYTPSTLSNSIENIVASPLSRLHDGDGDIDDVYTPSQKNGNNDSQIITYTPTKITHASKKIDLNRNDYTEKKTKRIKNKNIIIFGGDSGDEIDKDIKRSLRRELRSTPKKSQIESDKPKLQGNLDSWVNLSRPKRQDIKKDCDRSNDKKKIRKIGTSESVQKEMNEAEKMRYLREQFEKMDDTTTVVGHHRGHM